MTTLNVAYAASASITCGVASLATSSTFVAGRESTVVDNTTTKYDDVMLAGKVTVGTTPTTGTQILVYAYGVANDTPTYPDVLTGSDAAATITSAGVGYGFLKLVAALSVDSTTSNRGYSFGPVSLASLFGGAVPLKWGLFVAHNTGVNLNSTAGNHFFSYTGITYTSA